jgi:hypothetical protein
VKKRVAKRVLTELTFDQKMALMIGDRSDRPHFKTTKEARAAWRLCRDELLPRDKPSPSFFNCRAGHRPFAWWYFDSKQDRDPSVPEATQLFEMGEISDAEAQQCREDWAHYEKVALNKFEWCRDYLRRPETGAR